jgi:hypothetical protein
MYKYLHFTRPAPPSQGKPKAKLIEEREDMEEETGPIGGA